MRNVIASLVQIVSSSIVSIVFMGVYTRFKISFKPLHLVLQALEDRQRMCWVNQDAAWYDQHQDFDPCAEITAFKRQADMNYDTKYKNLPKYHWQAPPALMKVTFCLSKSP